MAYMGTCLCGEVSFSFQFDPMMQFQCHCSVCQKRFGSTLNALAMPEDELEVGELRLLEVDNRIVLPVNTHIRVLVTAADVLHS